MTNKDENPLGKTFWEYYKANYKIVPIWTGIMTLLIIFYAVFNDGFTWSGFWVVVFLILLNIFVIGLSNYQYKKQI